MPVTWLNEYPFEPMVMPNNLCPPACGVYMFCGLNAQNQWYPLYVGQAESLAARIPNHERWQEAMRLGATHVHVMLVPEAARRDAIERHLIQMYQPRLNVQLR